MAKTKSRIYIIGVGPKGIEVHRDQRRVGVTTSRRKLRDILMKVTDADIVMFSSSMDFPREYTKDKRILALVARLQRLSA